MDITAARTLLADQLTAAGFRAVLDPRAILAPCALIELPGHLERRSIGSTIVVAATVTLLAPANDPEWLEANVVTAMDAVGAMVADAAPYFMGDDARLPAYTIAVTVTVNA